MGQTRPRSSLPAEIFMLQQLQITKASQPLTTPPKARSRVVRALMHVLGVWSAE